MQSDRQLTWMIGLDWRQHRSGQLDDRTDLASIPEVAVRMGRELCAPWIEEPNFLTFAGVDRLDPALVDEYLAFDSEGRPIPSIHERSADLFRRKAEELGVPVGDPRSLTPDEWSDVHLTAWLQASMGDGARRAASGMAPLLARLAADGEIETYATKLGGGPAEPIPRTMWSNLSHDQAVRRLALCGLSIADPYEPAAPIDRMIFVDDRNLDEAIRRTALANYVPIINEDIRVWRPSDDRPIKLGDAMSVLHGIMTSGSVITNEALKARFLAITGRALSKGKFEEAKRRLLAAHSSLKSFGQGGPR